MSIYLDQLFINVHGTSDQKGSYNLSSESRGRPVKIDDADVKLFLKVYKQVRRSLKRGNQFEVAIEIKRLFRNSFNVDYWLQDDVVHLKSVNLDQAELEENRKKLLKILKLTGLTYYWYFCKYREHDYDQAYLSALSRLAVYYFNASPAAILQMRKRFMTVKLS